MHCCDLYVPQCVFEIDGKMIEGKDGGKGDVGVLVTQEIMIDTDASKVDTNTKADSPDASKISNINTPKIDVKTESGKPCAVSIALYRHVSLKH